MTISNKGSYNYKAPISLLAQRDGDLDLSLPYPNRPLFYTEGARKGHPSS